MRGVLPETILVLCRASQVGVRTNGSSMCWRRDGGGAIGEISGVFSLFSLRSRRDAGKKIDAREKTKEEIRTLVVRPTAFSRTAWDACRAGVVEDGMRFAFHFYLASVLFPSLERLEAVGTKFGTRFLIRG
jgi:hypothetical protein